MPKSSVNEPGITSEVAVQSQVRQGMNRSFIKEWNAMNCLKLVRFETRAHKYYCQWSAVVVGMLLTGTLYAQLPANAWTLLRQDPAGARRGSALRYAPKAGVFVLWGFMNDDPDLLQEEPLM